MTQPPWPTLSVVVPARNDAAHLPATITAICDQDYPARMEVVVAVGPSTDNTQQVADDLANRYPDILVVPNPAGVTSAGLNRAIEASTGAVVARVDAHAELADGYLRRAVEVLAATDAGNVGGIQRATGTTPFQRAVAAAMSSKFGTGDAKFHYGGSPGPVDTVYLGVFRRKALDEVGGYDETLVRNQDYELNLRLRRAGWLVWFCPDLEVVYRPRATPGDLARQYFQYGQWKREVLRRHPGSVRWRQLVAPIAVVANVAGLAVGRRIRAGWIVPATYATAVVAASTVAAVNQELAPSTAIRLPTVFAIMHHAWGLGFLRGVPLSGSRSRHRGHRGEPR